MNARKKLAPRKRPVRSTSQATVAAILQAATYILVKKGWEALTTNHVAERAGVNIASLYQYFPNKEAIVAELQRQHSAQIRELFPRAMPELLAQRDLRGLLRVMVVAVVNVHRVEPALHRVFAEELPRSARRLSPDPEPMKHVWNELARPFLKSVPDAKLASFIVRTTLHAAVHEAASEEPELLESPLFVEELVTLLADYLERAEMRGRSRPYRMRNR